MLDLSFLDAVPDVTWSAAIGDAVSGERLCSRGHDVVLRTASLAKLLLLIEVASQIETGHLDPGTRLHRSSTDNPGGSGVWQHLAVESLPVVDVAQLVAAASDNWATNVLVDIVGLDAVQARGRALGYRHTALLDRVRSERRPEHPPTISTGCAADWIDMLTKLERGELVDRATDARVRHWMSRSLDHSTVLCHFGLDPLSHAALPGRLTATNKTGFDLGVRADAGVIRGTRTLAYCILANWPARLDRAVLEAMREFGRRMRDML